MDTSLVAIGAGPVLRVASRCAYVPCGLLAHVPSVSGFVDARVPVAVPVLAGRLPPGHAGD